ncbi:MAG: translation initiation factor [Thermodesulfovibrionales bacterium]
MTDDKSRLVYSSDKVVPRNDKPSVKVPKETIHASQQRISVRLERKGRGGKSVTLIEGLQISAKDREALLKQLKTRIGTGGSLKNDVLEIQGDHRETIIMLLHEMGYKSKRAGG